MRQYVIYTRVSTQEQRHSGLGLAAQLRDIDIFLNSYSDVPWEILASFQDTGSGADNGRPEFRKAVALAKKTGAELLVAKLDRLSRKVSMLAALMDDPKLKLRVASMPHADKFQLHIYAALAEQERDFISKRTKAALAEARKRGAKLGGHRPGAIHAANISRKQTADANAKRMIAVIAPLRDAGLTLDQVAQRLNATGQLTPNGGHWHQEHIRRILKRVEAV
jgi:DNA invertase Pin-like site-specific DNA recombinase